MEKYLKTVSHPLAAYSFINCWIWQDYFEFDCVEIDQNLCLFAKDSAGEFLYWPPLGEKVSVFALYEAFRRMNRASSLRAAKSRGVARIENIGQDMFGVLVKEGLTVEKKCQEFLYLRRDIAELKGPNYKSKRHDVNFAVKNYEVEYRPYDLSMADDCARLCECWAADKLSKVKDDLYRMMVEDTLVTHRHLFACEEDWGVLGRVLKVEGRISAYTFGYFLNEEIFCDVAEIVDPKFNGLATTLFWKLCRDPELEQVKYINAMDDMLPDTVKRTKQSFRPFSLLPVYSAWP